MKYFDIHSHILPGVDDGASTTEEALGMLQIAYGEGIQKILLTPHYMRGRNRYTKEELNSIFCDFQLEAEKRFPDMELYLGNEVLYEDGVIEDLKNGLIQTMNNTKYVLVEFNIRISYQQLYDAIRKITHARFRPVIAHVERYRCLFKKPERIDELVGMEAYLQMNVSSLYGGILDENTRWCKKLVKEGYISLLGTDAHDLEERAPYVVDYVDWIKKKCGDEYLETLFLRNPERLVKNQYMIGG